MLSRRLALDLLSGLVDIDGAAAVARSLGFSEYAVHLDRPSIAALTLPDQVEQAALTSGPGALRAALVRIGTDTPLRPALAAVARALTRRAPHHQWMAIVTAGAGAGAAIAVWQQRESGERVCTLLFDPRRPLDSDAETLMALAAAADGVPNVADALCHLRWCEILGREALSLRFYRALEKGIVALGEGATGRASAEARKELALITTSRLLFLSFLQSRGWLDGDADFLARRVDSALGRPGGVHRQLFEPLFFGTLNTRPSRRARRSLEFGRVPFLNGGLFARSALERRYRDVRFRDSEVAALFDDVFTRFRFTASEERGEWREAAIDPEMLGHAFESLMASRERRDSGAFYTPHALVTRASDSALSALLSGHGVSAACCESLIAGHDLNDEDRPAVSRALGAVRVLDPACGTGAFLVHLLQRTTAFLRATGDARAPAAIRRQLLTKSIFGVDINPMAVWLCELRLWLAVVIDLDVSDPMEVPPLPNLDRNIRVGDALGGGSFETAARREGGRSLLAGVRDLRARYARATGARKRVLERRLDLEERRAAIVAIDRRIACLAGERRVLLTAARGRDLFGARRGAMGDERRRLEDLRRRAREARRDRGVLRSGGALPFRFESHFADVAATGGFDLIIGNPPWVRLHRIPADRREWLRHEFKVYREAAWRRGAEDAAAGAGFAAQVDLAALFTERGMALARDGGVLALLLPVKLWRSLAGGGVRRLLATDHTLLQLEDWSEAPSAFDASVYPALIVARKRGGAARPLVADDGNSAREEVRIGLHRRELDISWNARVDAIPIDDSPGAPWVLLPPDARRAFDRIASAGPPLATSGLGRPLLGVKSGLNAAFLVRQTNGDGGVESDDAERRGAIEPSMLRPVLRGESIGRWRPSPSDQRIVWTHDDAGHPLRILPPRTARWLQHWRSSLQQRADVRGRNAWWSLFRIEAAARAFTRVVWADVSRGPRACILPAGSQWVPLNSCYVLPFRDDVDAAAMAALLNSPIAAAWLGAVAEPARGGYRRYLGWTVARLPIPGDWERARTILAPVAARGASGEPVSDAELLERVASAYRLRAKALSSLIEWTWR